MKISNKTSLLWSLGAILIVILLIATSGNAFYFGDISNHSVVVEQIATRLNKIEIDNKYVCFTYVNSISCLYKEK